MITPMQELIEWIDTIISVLPDGSGAKNQMIIAKEKAESMLEKEKEVMESAWQDGMYECDGDGTFEDFYKTFNTKEK